MYTYLSARKRHLWPVALAGGTVLLGSVIGVRRRFDGRKADRIDRDLFVGSSAAGRFSPDLVADLPDPARRYLLHAIAPGTPLAPAARLQMSGTMTPKPGGPQVALTAEETLAPRLGFVWMARTRIFGLPARVRDYYLDCEGGVRVDLLGLIPMPTPGGADVARSSRGRLIAEAVWCPTALITPGVRWEEMAADRARFILAVDGEPVAVTIHVEPDGALREVMLMRWGKVRVPAWRPIPYGFKVEEEATFAGITIPVRLRGGWWYGTDLYDPGEAAAFTIETATFAGEQ